MLWYKSWLETRWRFLIGLALLVCSAFGIVAIWPKVVELLPLAQNINMSGEIGRQIREAMEVQREYRGYVWSQWFRQNLTQMGTLFAVLLGTGGLVSQSTRGGALFTLSLPVSRNRLLGVRAATGLAELFVMVLIPSLLIPLLSPVVGESYSLGDALVHGLSLFVAAATFFSLAFLLSTIFGDPWRPLLIALLLAVVVAIGSQLIPELSRYGIFRIMSAENYFRSGQVLWSGLLLSAAASIIMLYGAAMNISRRDF
jgi:ABC-type transport system involved in multi-copper enzyme maturation permease subunit